MDYSASNTVLWNSVIQFGMIAGALLLSNILKRKLGFVRKTLLPTAVLAGFILLILKICGVITPDAEFFERLTYHGIAIGFIAMSLRVPETAIEDKKHRVGLKSGAIIASSYMIQGASGLIISILLSLTFLKGLFPAAGLLLPMGYGQGPGQANNIGSSYEALGFAGGRSFGLAIAAAGYICACVVGVFYINYIVKKGKFNIQKSKEAVENVSVETFQSSEEPPMSESIDRLSIQITLVIAVYCVTFFATKGICDLLTAVAPGVAKMVTSLLWGFNFIIGSALAILLRSLLSGLRSKKIMSRQYQNNYLLNRISGLAFDIMITAGIASIEPEDLSGRWVLFALLAVTGGIVTFWHLRMVSKKVYGDYYYEGLLSMYGMMTGTISSGMLLLRELDPDLRTPAANNLVIGSSFAILLAAPLLVLVSLAAKSLVMSLVTLGLVVVYYFMMLLIINSGDRKREPKVKQ